LGDRTALLTMPSGTIRSHFDVQVSRKPSRTAIVADDSSVTFAELEKAVHGFVHDLRTLGIRRGDVVAVMLPNSAAFAVAAFGALCGGYALVPLDPQCATGELQQIFHDVMPRVAVVERTRHASLSWRAEGLPVIEVDERSVARWGERGASQGLSAFPDVEPDDVAAYFYTSGASGGPKAVVHTQRSLAASVDGLRRRHREFFRGSPLEVLRRSARLVVRYRRRVLRSVVASQVWFTPIGFHAIAGFSLLSQCVLTGQTLVTGKRFHPRRTLRLIEKHRVTTVAFTPTHADLVLRLKDLGDYDLSSVLVIGLGGSLAPPRLVERIREQIGCAVAIGYGSTETGGGILSTDLLDSVAAQATTVGRPFPGVEVRVVDSEGHDVDTGRQGELICRAPSLMHGYRHGVSGRGAAMADGWYHTGDAAFLDDDGRVHVLGRIDDVILRGGHTIHPSEIEHCISEVDGVEDVAVVGARLASGDQRITAYVVLRDKASTVVKAEDLQAACRGHLSAYKVPTAVVFRDELPKTAAGKVRRFVLREEATALAADQAAGSRSDERHRVIFSKNVDAAAENLT
jgi:fatty-acyl-CoA synthase